MEHEEVGEVVEETHDRVLPPGAPKSKPEREVLEDEAMPEWAKGLIPDNLVVPAGKRLTYMRFKSEWTDAPNRGIPSLYTRKFVDGKLVAIKEEHLSRVLVMWPINLAEERQAGKNSNGEGVRLQHELTKQMLRAVDGRRVDRGGNWAKDEALISCDQVWSDLGIKCRPMVIAHFNKLHRLGEEEIVDFFTDCVVVANAEVG